MSDAIPKHILEDVMPAFEKTRHEESWKGLAAFAEVFDAGAKAERARIRQAVEELLVKKASFIAATDLRDVRIIERNKTLYAVLAVIDKEAPE